MKLIRFIAYIFTIILALSCSSETTTKKPNVLLIIADDLGWGDIGYNNPENVFTPNLDLLASSGALFTQHYTMPQCTPTRVACFTGRYPGRYGYTGNQASNEKCFDIGTPTLATMLKSEGYRTHIAGKWHMGSDITNGPNHHGFDESYGSMAGAVGMYDHRYRLTGPWANAWHRNHQAIQGNEDGTHVTELMTLETQSVIREKSEKPFFMFLTYHAPHMPLDERGSFIDSPTQLDPNDSTRWLNEDKIKWFNDPEGKIQSEPDPEKRLLLAAVYHLDDAIGRIINTLEKEGKLENTIIMFSSDNGPQVSWKGNAYPSDLNLTNFNQSIPMRGSKLDVWEGGIHVPGFIYWKGKIQAKKIETPVHIIDWFPTLAGLTGHVEKINYHLDGLDLRPILFENRDLPKRDLYWTWSNNYNRWALRYGDWKVVKYGQGEPKLTEWELYNLKEDPMEVKNLIEIYPDKLAEMHQRFLAQRAKDYVIKI
jgi:arylsulfatase A-like enzyme